MAQIVAQPPRRLQDGQMAEQVGAGIGEGIFQRVANAGLRREMQDAVRLFALDQRHHGRVVGKIEPFEAESLMPFKACKTRLFQGRVVIGVQIVETDHPLAGGQQGLAGMISNEAGRAGHQDCQ